MTLRSPLLFAALGALTLLVSACGGTPPAGSGGQDAVEVSATFAGGGQGPAFTYDPALVPAGATAAVSVTATDTSTTTTLRVTGLLPNRAYGAHAHTSACAPTDGKAAGPHFQLRQDPVQPSVDPAYANPQNEIWLDLTTDAQGNAEATSTVPWAFPDDRRAAAVVIHEKATATQPGGAGTAGSRPACVSVGF